MGHVIRVDNRKEGNEACLTDTGTGGLFSAGYLRDRPAASYLEADETAVFVLANQKRGVDITRKGGTETITSGSGYRTIAVLTDRRVVIIVGDSSTSSTPGDQCLSVQLVDVDGVSTKSGRRDGQLTLTRANGGTMTIHCGADGLAEAAAYVTAGSQAWIHVENKLDDVKRSLVAATSRCDAGEYDAALEAAEDAYHGLSEPRDTATTFDSEWTAEALTARIDQVQARCSEMLADVHLGRGSRFSDEAEGQWREGAFEAAYDAFERATDELETVLTYDSAAVENRDTVNQKLDRIERMTEQLEAAPLQLAMSADRAAMEANEPTEAAIHWEEALQAYRVVLELDWGADERRFEGDTEQIRNRLGVVAKRLIAARRSAATTAKRAGDWYVGTEQYDVAIDEFETAREQYDHALEVAHDCYPDATEHLKVERDAVEARLERARAGRDGETVEPADLASDRGREPSYDVEATIGSDDSVEHRTIDESTRAESSNGEKPEDAMADGKGRARTTEEDATIETQLR